MKLLITGDKHLDNKTPRNRLDDRWETSQRKERFIAQTAYENKCSYVLQPGDFFDNYKASDFLKQWIIDFLRPMPFHTLTVFGQHDLRYHNSNTENTPLKVLEASRCVTILGKESSELPQKSGDISIYGCSWFEDVPGIKYKDQFNVLVMHKMVIKEKLWPGQEAEYGSHFLEKTEFDLIVSGDNHRTFILEKGNRFLINCGALYRNSIDLMDHKPICVVFDTDKRDYQIIHVPIEPADKVFDLTKIKTEKEVNEKLKVFVDGLKEQEVRELDFEKELERYIRENKVDEYVQLILNEIMED